MTVAIENKTKGRGIPFTEGEFQILTPGGFKAKVKGFIYGDTGLGYQMCPCGHGFVVTHIPSGYKVLKAHFPKSRIQPFVRGIAGLMDWTPALPEFDKTKTDEYHELVAKYQIFNNWGH